MKIKSTYVKLACFSIAATLFTPSLCRAAELSRGDKEFFKDASQIGLTELELGKLAQTKGASVVVKNLASKLVTNYTKTLDDLRELAKAKNIGIDWRPTVQQQTVLAAFEKKSGTEFDKDFRDYVAKEHEKAIKIFGDVAKETEDPDMRAYANRSLIALRTHRLLATGYGKPEAVGERTVR